MQVVFDPSWNPAHDLQAQDRAYRLGQTRDVAVYRLVGTGGSSLADKSVHLFCMKTSLSVQSRPGVFSQECETAVSVWPGQLTACADSLFRAINCPTALSRHPGGGCVQAPDLQAAAVKHGYRWGTGAALLGGRAGGWKEPVDRVKQPTDPLLKRA